MFGKPEWFRDKTFGWGLVPVAWQGWVYTAVWFAVLVIPFMLLLNRENPLGACVWLGAMIAAMFADVWHIKRARLAASGPEKSKEPLLYIGDEEAVSTKNLDLRLRR